MALSIAAEFGVIGGEQPEIFGPPAGYLGTDQAGGAAGLRSRDAECLVEQCCLTDQRGVAQVVSPA
jgi:hypothetical protein